jgi:alpha-1,3-mannosylglycoprotein beta-1,4-N-acetylglucosaminyltransferase C
VSPQYPKPHPHFPSMFQHTGKKSSLAGKKQTAKDKLFDSNRLFTYRGNIGVDAFSNIVFSSPHKPSEAVSAAGFFWSKASPKSGDWFLVVLSEPTLVEYLVVVMGNSNHPDDQVLKMDVEISHAVTERTRKTAKCAEPYQLVTSFGSEGELGHNGILGYNMTSLEAIQCVRLKIIKPRSQNWLLISEIAVALPGLKTIVMNEEGKEEVVDWAKHLRQKYDQNQNIVSPHGQSDTLHHVGV